MQEFSPAFIHGAKEYLASGRGLSFKDAELTPITEEDVVPTFFTRLSSQYGSVVVDPHESVRRNQEDQIADELLLGRGVLLRGFWKTGQSSMIKALERRFGETDSLSLDFYVSNKRFNETEIPTIDGRLFVSVEEVLALPDTELRRIAELKERERMMLLVSAQIHPGHDCRIAEIFADFNTHYLRPLNREEVTALVNSPLANSPVSVTEEALNAIAEYCGGWPTAVKGFFRTFVDGYSPFKRFKEVYDIEDVKQLTNRPLKELFGSRFGYPLGHFARIYLEGIGTDQQRALGTIATARELPVSELDPKVVDILLKTGLVITTPDHQAFKINGVFLRELITSDLIQVLSD